MPLIVFEGLDQSGKETQAQLLRAFVEARGRRVESLTFPDDTTSIGQQIRSALGGGHHYGADVLQLLFIANRYERKRQIEGWLQDGIVVICDRYLASSVAYGEAQGLDAEWLMAVQRFLPEPALTVLLDIEPETALARKQTGRDRYERDLQLLARVRDSYRRQVRQPGWVRVDGNRPRDEIASEISAAAAKRLGLP